MLQGHLIPRRLLHILDFQWSKSFHWNVQELKSQRWRRMFSESAWLSSKNIDYYPGSMASFFQFCYIDRKHYILIFSFCNIFLYIPRGFHITNLPYEIHATIHLDLRGQMQSQFHVKLQMCFLHKQQPWIIDYSWVWFSLIQRFGLDSMKSSFIMLQVSFWITLLSFSN